MKYIVGIDEVGRGPLAGPVTVCVVVCHKDTYAKLKKNKNLPKSGKDSKKLKPDDREKYNLILKKLSEEKQISYCIIHISNKIIDSKGLSFSIKKAISDGIKKLGLKDGEVEVLLDGGLKAPLEFSKQKTIIKGDEKEKIIAWASILAKVSRDSLMLKLAKKYPKYGFEVHKGYGTKKHRDALLESGLSAVHRRTFCGKY
ncbi:MAG: ribonuclease HII [Parcubacteria group bacterium]